MLVCKVRCGQVVLQLECTELLSLFFVDSTGGFAKTSKAAVTLNCLCSNTEMNSGLVCSFVLPSQRWGFQGGLFSLCCVDTAHEPVNNAKSELPTDGRPSFLQ